MLLQCSEKQSETYSEEVSASGGSQLSEVVSGKLWQSNPAPPPFKRQLLLFLPPLSSARPRKGGWICGCALTHWHLPSDLPARPHPPLPPSSLPHHHQCTFPTALPLCICHRLRVTLLVATVTSSPLCLCLSSTMHLNSRLRQKEKGKLGAGLFQRHCFDIFLVLSLQSRQKNSAVKTIRTQNYHSYRFVCILEACLFPLQYC